MEVIYGIIPGVLLLGLVTVGLFFWAARSGQFDDMEGDAQRILMDEDLSPTPPSLVMPAEEAEAAAEAQSSPSASGDAPDRGNGGAV
jgi:cbb3-type cytochrome oxidase maturation protein